MPGWRRLFLPLGPPLRPHPSLPPLQVCRAQALTSRA